MVPFTSLTLVRSIHLFLTVHCVKLKQITCFHQILYETRRYELLYVVHFTASHMCYLNYTHRNLLVLSNQSTPFRWLVTMTTKKVILVMPLLDPMGPLCLSFVKSAFSSILSGLWIQQLLSTWFGYFLYKIRHRCIPQIFPGNSFWEENLLLCFFTSYFYSWERALCGVSQSLCFLLMLVR